MTTVTKYATSVTQASSTTSNHYKQWGNLAYTKDAQSHYAECGANSSTIAGKNGTYKRPSLLTFKGFNTSINTDAEIVSVTVEYAHSKSGSLNIQAPTIMLYNGSTKLASKSGVKPTSSMTGHTVTFTTSLSTSVVNSNNFSVKVAYPSNANTNPGLVRLKYVRVKINYNLPSFVLGINNSNSKIIEGTVFPLDFSLTNTNKTSYNPSPSITLPNDVTYEGINSGTGTITQNGQVLTWNPKISKSVTQSSIKLNLKSSSTGSKTVTFSSDYATTVTSSLNVQSKPLTVEVTPPTDLTIKNNSSFSTSIIASANELFNNTSSVYFDIRGDYSSVSFTLDDVSTTLTPTTYTDADNITWNRYTWTPDMSSVLTHTLLVTVSANSSVTTGGTIYSVTTYSTDLNLPITISTYDSTVTAPYYTGVILADEELNKMGDEYPYKVSSLLYVDDEEEHYSSGVPNYEFNHRIGIFNELLGYEDTGTISTGKPNNEYTLRGNATRTLLTEYTELNFGLGSLDAVILNYDICNDFSMEFDCQLVQGTQLFFAFTGLGGGIEYSDNTYATSGEWVHYTVTRTGETIHVYADGQEIQASENTLSSNDVDLNFNIYYHGPVVKLNIKNIDITLNLIDEEKITYAYNHLNSKAEEQVKTINTWTESSCEFTYDSDYPVIILIMGEVQTHASDINLKFTNPCVQEIFEENEYQDVNNFPSPFENLISETETSTVKGDSNKFVLYDFQDLETIINNEDLVILGATISFNYQEQEEISILATLRLNGKTGDRSLTLTEETINNDEIITIGDDFDKWDILWDELEDLEIIISSVGSNNTTSDLGTLNFYNPILSLYYAEIPETEYTCYVDEEDTRNYGLILKDVDIPYGIDTTIQSSQVTGTDFNNIYRQNINSKEITITFDVHTESLKTSTELVQQISKLFVNTRDKFNKPTPKRVEFSHLSDKYFECVLADSISNSVVITDYSDCKIKLTVPSGTSCSKKEVVTYLTGSNNSLVKVNPLLKLTNLSSNITINETVSKQSFQIRDTGLTDDTGATLSFTTNDYLEINCTKRTSTLYKYNSDTDQYKAHNVTKGVDFSSDWFILNGKYTFNSTGANIKSISYTERW